MENTNKVFYSEIIRDENQSKNNLYDLLNIIPATPLELTNSIKSYNCDFNPKTDKIFIPKRRPRVKVKTVRDIRALYESETYAYLTKDLKTQQDYVLKKIKSGNSQNDKTIEIAKKILKADSPITRSCWQMLTNINPENQKNTRQFVLWNGKFIQVNGSTGGKNKLICNYDLAFTKLLPKINKKTTKNTNVNKRKGLLRNSLAIKFKPGPLGKKKYLDDSHQKYNGDIELIELPKVGLDVQPMYGTTLEPTTMCFLRNLVNGDGKISEKWAEFAVSTLGKIEKSNAKLLSSECITFEMNYKCNQHRILMLKDFDALCLTKENRYSMNENLAMDPQTSTLSIIKYMMSKILDAVEISVNQDNIFSPDEDVYEMITEDLNPNTKTASLKEKIKNKYCELEKLDVTVIQLSDNLGKETNFSCRNLYCALGCVCDSLKTKTNFNQHCGREECMFDCKCEFSKYANISSLDIDSCNFKPVSKENDSKMRLAKEEQKFHQTIIVTEEKDILFKSDKRNDPSSKRYKNISKNFSLESNKMQCMLSVTALKINCENVQPWCLVHNLYKCFCKGIFTENNSSPPIEILGEESSSKDIQANVEPFSEEIQEMTNDTIPMKKSSRPRLRQSAFSGDNTININPIENNNSLNSHKIPKRVYSLGCNAEKCRKSSTVVDHVNAERNKIPRLSSDSYDKNNEAVSENSDSYEPYDNNYSDACSRVTGYEGRKFSNGYYNNINYKIKEMEKNDKTLQQKMLSILKKDLVTNTEVSASTNSVKENTLSHDKKPDQPQKQTESGVNFIKILYDTDELKSGGELSKEKRLPIDNRLATWLESNYKLYKKRIDEGLLKTSLEPPKVGKMVLHSWDFILSRYRDRKNLFLISKLRPYRIFMAVHTRSPFFQTCMNINEIRFADLHKYPQTVKNLLTNATHLKDNFCILRGCAHCWELVGSVAKISKDDENSIEINDDASDSGPSFHCNQEDVDNEQLSFGSPEKEDLQMQTLKDTESLSESSDEAETSKWFVMTVENDFSEIRFYKKGFFVKYESIVKAINVARVSGKTVRLSSQKCVDKTSGPQFGVYAIPNASEYCVFIGPYEIKDSLGIETIKTILDIKKIKRTRGFWITTNKIDNIKVIDNPMSFMPLTSLKNREAVLLESHFFESTNIDELSETPDSKEKKPTNSLVVTKSKKIVKPIKIQKPKTYYQIASDGSLKQISLKNPRKLLTYTSLLNPNLQADSESTLQSLFIATVPDNTVHDIQHTMSSVCKDSLEEDEPQLKITAVYSQNDKSISKCKRTGDRGMFILKPEEINRKVMEQNINSETATARNLVDNIDDEISTTEAMDNCIKGSKNLATCSLDSDVYVISDDESDIACNNDSNLDCWKDVIIQCTTVTDHAWILGRQKPESNLLSFRVPGGEFSTFYPEEEAFQQLNYELSSIVDSSCRFNLQWKVVDSTDGIENEASLTDPVFWRRVLANKGQQSSQNEVVTNVLKSNTENIFFKKNTVSTIGASSITDSDGDVEAPDTVPATDNELESMEIEQN